MSVRVASTQEAFQVGGKFNPQQYQMVLAAQVPSRTPREFQQMVRDDLQRTLRNKPYRIFTAQDAAEALEIMENQAIDLVISDSRMPDMDGPTLLTKVRQRMPELKVIFVSGYAEENVRQDIADNQSVEFLPKPYSLDQINSKVKEVLGKIED